MIKNNSSKLSGAYTCPWLSDEHMGARMCTVCFGCAHLCTVCARECTRARCARNPDGYFQHMCAECVHICRMCAHPESAHLRHGHKDITEWCAARRKTFVPQKVLCAEWRRVRTQLAQMFCGVDRKSGDFAHMCTPKSGDFCTCANRRLLPSGRGAEIGDFCTCAHRGKSATFGPAAILINAYSGNFCHPV